MLTDVLGSFLDAVEEREFDAPLMELLRARGFYDIHFVHGPFEFGKDVIAKHDGAGQVEQWAFQSKAGDISLGEWNRLRGQLESLRTNPIAHPSFDSYSRRRPVLVTTGRLVGGAAPDAQQWAEYLRGRGEIPVEIWDRERLIEYLSPEIAIAGTTPASFLAFIGRIGAEIVDDRELERFSREWLEGSDEQLLADGFQAALIANRFAVSERLDLACITALCLLRAVWAKMHGDPTARALSAANLARKMFSVFCERLWQRCSGETLDARGFLVSHELPTAFVTYPVRCSRLIELLGLFGLLNAAVGQEADASQTADFVEQFIGAHPGAAHPISDRWAVSLIPPSLLLIRAGRSDKVVEWLTGVMKWTEDRIEKAAGLAPVDSTPTEEVERLIGPALEHLTVERRRESYVATVLLDLAALIRNAAFYELVINEVLAVKATPTVLVCTDDIHQYRPAGHHVVVEPNPPYVQAWEPTDGWRVAPHHRAEPANRFLDSIGRSWDLLAIGSVLRDRHFLSACQQIISGA